MHTEKATTTCSRRGIALLMSLLFLAVFSSLGLAIFTMSSRNMHVANNHSQAGRALESAFSGMEVMKYWISTVSIDGATEPDQWYETMRTDLATNLADNNIAVDLDNPDNPINSDNPMILNTSQNKSFYVELLQDINNDDIFQVRVTGQAGQLRRTVAINYNISVDPNTNNIFDFGVASKGSVEIWGNVALSGTNIAVEADVYIESVNNNVLFIDGNSQIAGDVKITNPDGIVTLKGGQAGIGTRADGTQVTGEAESQDYITKGVAPVDFPVPNTAYFEQYVTGDTIDLATDLSGGGTYENVRIAAGTNPDFSGGVTINGIMFIETPNVVTFSGNCDISGLIIGDGDMNDDSSENKLTFLGNVSSSSVSELPLESQYDGLRDETGTFLMAPGFHVSFGGSFDTLNGAIAANGITFFGNAGGTIAGSVLNYSETPMILSGNNDLFFSRSGTTKVPAGFDFELEIVLDHDPASYDEPEPEPEPVL